MADKTIIQTGIGLDRDTLSRCDRLRAATGRSRSYVIEQALRADGLRMLEQEHADAIEMFDELATSAGLTWQQYAAAYVDAFGAKTYPPSVADLAEMKFTGRQSSQVIERALNKLAARKRADAGQGGKLATVRESIAASPVEERDEEIEFVPPPAPSGLRDLR